MPFSQYIDSLHQTILDLIRHHDIETLLPQIIERAVNLIKANRGFIYLVNPDGQTMSQSMTYGFDVPSHDDVTITKDMGISGFVWRTRKPQIIYNYSEWSGRIQPLDEPVINIAGIPLMLDDEVIGVLCILKDDEDAIYTDDDIKMLTSFADLAAIAIENTRLYQNLRESEYFNQQITALVPGIIFVYDLKQNKNLYANEAISRVLDISYGDVIGSSGNDLRGFIYPDDLPMFRAMMRRIIAGETEGKLEFRLRHISGTWRWFEVQVSIFKRDDNGEPEQIICLVQDIDEHRRTEESLRTNESRLRAILDSAAMGIAISDVNNVVESANPAFYNLMGYTAEELTNEITIKDYTHPDDLKKEDVLREELRDGKRDFLQLEKRFIRKTGEIIWVRKTASLIDRKTMQSVVIVEDITERKAAEDALRESESRFRTLIENAPDSIFVYDVDTGFLIDANQNALNRFGYTLDELSRMTPLDLVRLEDGYNGNLAEMAQYVIDKALKGESPVINARGETATGEIRHFELRLVRLPGEKSLLRVSAVDVTERLMMEQALRESESRFRRLMDVVPIGIFIYQNSELVYLNPNGASLTGYTIEDVIGGKFWDLLHPDSYDVIAELLSVYNETGNFNNQIEVKVFDHDGKIRWFDVHLVEFDVNSQQAILGTVVDITERKLAEENRVALLLEKERVKLLADFVRDASHDFRTPLSTINTSVYLLSRITDIEKQQYHIEMLKGQVKHLDKLVNGLLTLSQLDSGLPFKFAPYNLLILLDEIKAGLDTEIHEKNLHLHIEPANFELPLVMVDSVQISHALREVALNAVRHTPSGGTITIYTHINNGYVDVVIQDTGVGIAPENLSRIFDRFYRGEESQMAGGLGLGLSIARKILDYHNGKISAVSTVGEGSIFTVSLPIGGSN